jgi:hypothetical protein
VSALSGRLDALEALLSAEADDDEIPAEDRLAFDWYGGDCGCPGVKLGDCERHHRARENQRPPDGDWRQWMLCAGRGSGKTKAGAEYVRHIAETNPGARIALVGGTHQDVVTTMIEGPSGVLSVCPDWAVPDYRKTTPPTLTWPNGSRAVGYSAEQPARLRGPAFSHAWCDELAHWFDAESAWRQLNFTSRVRSATGIRILITTTPIASPLVRALAEDPLTRLVRFSTYENQAHLAPEYIDYMHTMYDGTDWGEQEVFGRILMVGGHRVFGKFKREKHVSAEAAYHPVRGPVNLTVDAGTSLWTGALWWQLAPGPSGRKRLTILGEYAHDHTAGSYTAECVEAIHRINESHPEWRDRVGKIYLDPHGQARTSGAEASKNAYETKFNDKGDPNRVTAWQGGREIPDSAQVANHMLDLGDVLVHPSCVRLIEAIECQQWKKRRDGSPTDEQDPQRPGTDLCDAFRGATIVAYPGGLQLPPTNLRPTTFRYS